jgi:phospholipid/cholesterol/gamma-HCH transport system substrate-binding protein
MEASKSIQYKVGVFVSISLLLTLAFIIALGGDKAILHRTFTLKIKSADTGGLSNGSIIQISGITAGNVAGVDFDQNTNDVVVRLTIDRRFLGRITKNSVATLQTQGALGDKYILIRPGEPGGEPLKDQDYIPLEAAQDLISTLGRSGSKFEKIFDILENVDKLTMSLNQKDFAGNLAETARNLKSSTQSLQEILASVRGSDPKNNRLKVALDHMSSIFEKIDNGQGTLGGLVNDPTIHDDLKTILGGAKRSTILKYIIRQTIKNSDEDEQGKPDHKK